MAGSKLQAFWNHPAGPKTIHFWASTAKWVLTIANIADFSKPPEKISYPQQLAVTCTGLNWTRYSMVIIPELGLEKKNRILCNNVERGLEKAPRHDHLSDMEAAAAKE